MTIAPAHPTRDGPSSFLTKPAAPYRKGRTGPNEVARHLNARVRTLTAGLDNVIGWRTRDDRMRRAEIGPHLYDAGIESSLPVRLEYRWPLREAYSGEHWFSHTGESLHYESMTERSAMIQLAYHHNRADQMPIIAAATQPLVLVRWGATRFPDLMLGLEGGERRVIDVKRRKALTDDVLVELALTREVCKEIGWKYSIVSEAEPVVEFNLETLSARRHPRYAPSLEFAMAVADVCRRPRPLGAVADAVGATRGEVIPYLLHLMWVRVVDPVTLSVPLDWDTPVAVSAYIARA